MNKLSLENQMCFKFYALSRHITSIYKPILHHLDLTYPQYLVMLVLWEKGEVSVKNIGHHLMLDSGTLTPLLKRLEQKKLVNRKRSGVDERRVEVTLTKAGEDMKQKALSVPDHLYQSMNIDAEELRQFVATLNKMMDQIVD